MNLFRKLTQPPYPNSAIGLDSDGASIVALERRGKRYRLRSAGYVNFAEELVHPSFDDPNIISAQELADTLLELSTSVGMNRQTHWSVTLPEATTRSALLTIEGAPNSRAELEEMLGWKIERAFHHSLGEMRIARYRLSPDERGRVRYLVTGVRLSVLAEYEDVLRRLGWQAGLILPRHMGEAWWLMRDSPLGDALLVSSHEEGFTALISRDGEPVIVRNVLCDAEDSADELFRLLLFYRDRLAASPHAAADDVGGEVGAEEMTLAATNAYGAEGTAHSARTIERVLIVGDGMDEATAHSVIADTLDTRPRLLRPEDFSLTIPTTEMRFDQIAAPAGLAALA